MLSEVKSSSAAPHQWGFLYFLLPAKAPRMHVKQLEFIITSYLKKKVSLCCYLVAVYLEAEN